MIRDKLLLRIAVPTLVLIAMLTVAMLGVKPKRVKVSDTISSDTIILPTTMELPSEYNQ
tara:strand:+ start:235 stop:411 length:177 start_codon:yes stop_codon:yes gene_type:complete